MATVTFDAAGPGKAGKRPLFVKSPRPVHIVTGTFDFDSSYPTGGEDISSIADAFGTMLGCIFESKGGYTFSVDYTANAEKVLAYYGNYDAADGVLIEVPGSTSLATVTGVRFIAWGYTGTGEVS